MASKSRDDDEIEEIVPIRDRHVVMTPTGVTFMFNEEDQIQARHCLERSGRITLNFGEVSLSNLTEIRRLEHFAGGPDGGVGPID
jgi:hypothetical protein